MDLKLSAVYSVKTRREIEWENWEPEPDTSEPEEDTNEYRDQD